MSLEVIRAGDSYKGDQRKENLKQKDGVGTCSLIDVDFFGSMFLKKCFCLFSE